MTLKSFENDINMITVSDNINVEGDNKADFLA